MSIGTLLSSLLFEIAKNLGGRTASDFLLKKIKKKLKRKYNKDPDKEKLSEDNLELIRSILHEELESYGISSKQVDMLIMKAVKELSAEHEKILSKLDIVEGLLVKLSATLLYEAHVEGTDVPDELSEKLFERFIAGDDQAEKKILEYIEEGNYSLSLQEKLQKYQPIRQIYRQEDILVTRFLKQITQGSEKDYGKLALFAELWSLIGSPVLDTNLILEKIVVELLDNTATLEETDPSNLMRFLHLLDMTNAIEKLTFQAKSYIISFLTSEIQQATYYQQIEIAYFLMKMDASFPELISIVEQAIKQLSKQKFSDRFVKESISIDKKILGFFKKHSSFKIDQSLRALRSLVKRFQQRQFKRSTTLLQGQLTRTLSETNLLAVNIEDLELDDKSIKALKETVLDLIDVLIKASERKELNEEIRLLVWKNIDNCLFIINKLAMHNTATILKDFEIDLAKFHGIYSDDLGTYERMTTKEIRRTLRHLKIAKTFIEKVEIEKKKEIIKAFPEPPTGKIAEKKDKMKE
ncbi:MAG: hypothetical protein ACTSYD_09970 [Candidatus Heimdallarchaeaceae archaeon]